MVTEIITLDENAFVTDAADIMDQNEISCLIAARKGKAIGIITERDLFKRVIVEAKNAEKTEVAEVMLSPLEVVASGTDWEKVVRLMFEKKTKLPVLKKDPPLDLVSLTDIARFQPTIITL